MGRGSGSEKWLVGDRAKGKLEDGERMKRVRRGGGMGGLKEKVSACGWVRGTGNWSLGRGW